MSIGHLLLETGDIFQGNMIGAKQEKVGEVVFNTSMTGYQEIMTDPSYAGQIVTFCYPLIGNYGLNTSDNESFIPHLSGMIVGEICDDPSHYLAAGSFADFLTKANVSCLAGVDTRALVKIIRKYGTVKGTIISEQLLGVETDSYTDPYLAARDETFWNKRELPAADSLHWVNKVSTKQVQVFYGNDRSILAQAESGKQDGAHIVLMDYGCKKSILASLLCAGCQVTVVPYSFSYEQVKLLQPDGVVLSNGPGDPMALKPFFGEIKRISASYPSLGICLGHQLLALAHGAQTEKLKYGHRGGNHPVKEQQTGKVLITPQNHSYVVQESSIDPDVFEVTYRNVNDTSIEGLSHKHLAVQTIQFHPEAHPGPGDSAHIFDQFIAAVMPTGDMHYAVT